MPFPTPIRVALENYDKNKGPRRRLIGILFPSTGFQYQAAIRALHKLSEADQANILKLYCCFIENKPEDTQESYKVYRALLNYLASLNSSNIPEIFNQLDSNQLLNSINLEKLNPLAGDHFRKFSILLNNLNTQYLLTQLNFDNITTHFATDKENISEMLSSMLISVNQLYDKRLLTQENLKCLLKKPLQAKNIASILVILDQNEILTSANRIQLNDEKNEPLLRNEAYSAIWHPLEDYFNTIVPIVKKQSIFELICSTQSKKEIEETEKYVHGLISQAKPARRNTLDKFSTAPSPRIRTRSMICDLNHTMDRPGTL